jgi:hypothetical protein
MATIDPRELDRLGGNHFDLYLVVKELNCGCLVTTAPHSYRRRTVSTFSADIRPQYRR